MKILTANIALGLEGMDRFFPAMRGHFAFHIKTMAQFLLYPRSLKHAPAYSSPQRVRYLARHVNLQATFDLIEREHADILILNEVLPQFHGETLSPLLARLGYRSVSWGESLHYPDATLATVVASKLPGIALPIDLSWESHAGGGAGIAAIRLDDLPVTVIGLHLGMADKFPWLYDAEIKALAKFISEEQATGRGVVIAGDWNASAAVIRAYPAFAQLGLTNADGDIPTCPTFLPWLKPLDHIFMPSGWPTKDLRTIPFGSDHLALAAEIGEGVFAGANVAMSGR